MSVVRGPTGLGGRDQRFQEAELVIRQGLAGAEVSNQRAISGRPHGGLQARNRLQRRLKGQDQPVKPVPSPFSNGHSVWASDGVTRASDANAAVSNLIFM